MNKKTLSIVLFLVCTGAYASSKGTGTIADLKWNAINFILLFGFLGIKLKKPLREMFDKNADDVTALFSLAEKKDREAQLRLNEYQKKLDGLEHEKSKIMTEAKQNVDVYSKNHITETDGLIVSLNSDAKSRIENEKVQMDKNLNSTLLDVVISKVKTNIVANQDLQKKATNKLVSQI